MLIRRARARPHRVGFPRALQAGRMAGRLKGRPVRPLVLRVPDRGTLERIDAAGRGPLSPLSGRSGPDAPRSAA